jgi:hypothetical protein
MFEKVIIQKAYLLLAIIFFSSCSPNLPAGILPPINPDISLTNSLQNSREILSTNTTQKPPVFKIQIHGQSVMRTVKERHIKAILQTEFPEIDFEINNSSRSGFRVPQLLPLIEEDIFKNSADLLFFHAYGGTETGELNQFCKKLKERFRGDVVIINHHLSYIEDEKLNDKLTIEEDNSSLVMESIARTYGFGFIDLRKDWRTYIELNHQINSSNLLRDFVHPNDCGKALLEWIITQHFIRAVQQN